MLLDSKPMPVKWGNSGICLESMPAPDSKSLAELALTARTLEDPEDSIDKPGLVYLKDGKAMENFVNPESDKGIVDSREANQFICMKGDCDDRNLYYSQVFTEFLRNALKVQKQSEFPFSSKFFISDNRF